MFTAFPFLTRIFRIKTVRKDFIIPVNPQRREMVCYTTEKYIQSLTGLLVGWKRPIILLHAFVSLHVETCAPALSPTSGGGKTAAR